MNFSLSNLIYLLEGFWTTISITLIAWPIMVILGILLAVFRLYGDRTIRLFAVTSSEVVRGASTFVLLYWAFYVLPQFGIRLPAYVVGILVLAIVESSYAAEDFRGALLSVSKTQHEAAKMLGLTKFDTFRLVILLQALSVVIQPLGNTTIRLLKFTSLLSFITVDDLVGKALNLRSVQGDSVLIFSVVLITYYLLALGISKLFRMASTNFAIANR